MQYLLGIDIGTTSTIGILIGLPDKVLATASCPVTLFAPHSGWTEESPEQWWANVGEICQQLLTQAASRRAKSAVLG
jgi:xylulokinase